MLNPGIQQTAMNQHINFLFYYFPSKIFFGKKIFNSVLGTFFLKLPMTRRLRVLQSRIVGSLYKTYVWLVIALRVRKLEVMSTNTSIGQYFSTCFQLKVDASVNFIRKKQFFDSGIFSLNTYPFST